MICNRQWGKHMTAVALVVGGASFLFGLLGFLIIQPDGKTINTFLGMLTGFGAGIIFVAVYKTIRARVVSKEKLEQEKIEKQDERSVAINHAAGLVGCYVGIVLFCVLCFLFMLLGYTVPSYICLAALYVLAGAVAIARRVISGRM